MFYTACSYFISSDTFFLGSIVRDRINAHPRCNHADNLIGSHGRVYNCPAIGIECRNRKHKHIVFSSRGDSAERATTGRSEGRQGEREREREQDTTSAGEFEGRQSVAGGTSGTT